MLEAKEFKIITNFHFGPKQIVDIVYTTECKDLIFIKRGDPISCNIFIAFTK